MKYRLLIILILVTIAPSFAQDIKKITLTSQQADEPPTKQGRPKFIIEFDRQSTGDFVAMEFSDGKKRKLLPNTVTIEKERVEKVIQWQALNKNEFSAAELDIDIETLKAKEESSHYDLNFGVSDQITVQVDSFNFCQSLRTKFSHLIGGETLTVTLVYNSKTSKTFTFDRGDVGRGKFNIQEYIFCYSVINNRIPAEFPHYNLFSADKFVDIILYYLKTVECEDYYYKEYADQNPSLSSKDKRMRTGWDFVKYLEQRTKKE